MISFIVYGKCIPKGRPRFAMKGRFPVAYTPAKTRMAESDFRSQAIANASYDKDSLKTPLEGPLRVTMRFFKPRPKSCKAKEWIQRCDLDNMVKLCTDSLNRVFWVDDSQITELHAFKGFGEARTEVWIEDKEEGSK